MTTETDYNSYKALKARSRLMCEFCDQVFNNRFSSIVHNSSHIIIPLLKNHVHRCHICYFYFTSAEDFNTHMNDKHPPIINNYNNINFNLKVPAVKLEKLPQINSNKFKDKDEIFDGEEYDSSSSDEFLVKREIERNEFKNEEKYTDFIKRKLKFEVNREGLLKDFTTDCEVNIQYTWSNNNKDIETNSNSKRSITNNIVFEEPVDEFEFENILSRVPLKFHDGYESIHYKDLMSCGSFKCRYCSVYISNRFSLIIHETSHMRFKKTRNKYLLCHQCDRYIAGNHCTLKRHEATSHGTVCTKKEELQTCKTCGFRYRKYSTHIRNHHRYYEYLEGSNMVEPIQEFIQNDLIEKTSVIKVCDLCYSFFKNSTKKTYILKDKIIDTIERPCDECKNLFFELKTVKTITRINKTSQINRSTVRQRYTNEKRLKNIQIRLKMINKLRKFYNVLLFMFSIRTSLNRITIIIIYSQLNLKQKYNGVVV